MFFFYFQNDRTEVLTVHSLFLVVSILLSYTAKQSKSNTFLNVYPDFQQWNDFHVVWKPSEFDDTYYIRTNGWYLWTPDLGILNS